MGAVPVERAPHPVGEIDLWAPARQLAELARVDVLAVDLAVGDPVAEVFGLDSLALRRGDQVDDLAHRMRMLAACVEGLPPRSCAVESVGYRQIGRNGV